MDSLLKIDGILWVLVLKKKLKNKNRGIWRSGISTTCGVLPKYQKKGIGSKLIKEGHIIAKKLGYHYSVVLGSNEYYSKFGYIPAIEYGIKAPFDVQSENFMAIKLNDTSEDVQGVVKYAKEFGI